MNQSLLPWRKTLSLAALTSAAGGFLAALAYVLLPADPKHALLLGFSAARWVMLLTAVAGGLALVWLGWAARCPSTRWLERFFGWLQQTVASRLNRTLLFSVLIAGVVVCLLAATGALYRTPFSLRYQSVLLRLAPLAVWGALLLLQAGWWLLACFAPPAAPVRHTRRVEFIDFARGAAIFLTIASHVFSGFNTWAEFGAASPYVRLFTRLGTPTFIMITGIMFELVYLRRVEQYGFGMAARRLAERSLLCYITYIITVLVEVFTGYLTLRKGLLAMLFVGESSFSNILKFYTILLLLAIPLLWLRRRYGLRAMLLLTISAWIFILQMDAFWWAPAGTRLAAFTALLVGRPEGQSANSILHSLLFLTIGMSLGSTLRNGISRNFHRLAWILTGAAALVSVGFFVALTPRVIIEGYAFTFRLNHNPAYYALGSTAALLTLLASCKVMDLPNAQPLKNFFLTIGKDTLWAFALGNSLVALALTHYRTPLWLDLILGFVLPVMMAALLVAKNKVKAFVAHGAAESVYNGTGSQPL